MVHPLISLLSLWSRHLLIVSPARGWALNARSLWGMRPPPNHKNQEKHHGPENVQSKTKVWSSCLYLFSIFYQYVPPHISYRWHWISSFTSTDIVSNCLLSIYVYTYRQMVFLALTRESFLFLQQGWCRDTWLYSLLRISDRWVFSTKEDIYMASSKVLRFLLRLQKREQKQ